MGGSAGLSAFWIPVDTAGRDSALVNLADADLKPAGWNGVEKPKLTALGDATIYELHVRDFSISDASVSAAKRGTFRAFG